MPTALVVLTYEFMSQGRLNDMEEMILPDGRASRLHWIANASVPLAVLSIVFVTHIALRSAVVFLSGLAKPLMAHVVVAAVLDVLAPSLIAFMVGAMLASHAPRFTAYACVALFVFLIGPFSEFVPKTAVLASYGSAKTLDLYPLFRPFWILPPDATFELEPSYGFPIEGQRWTFAGFWLCALAALELPRIVRRPHRWILTAFLGLAAGLLLLSTIAPASILRHEMGPGGTSNMRLDI